MDCFARCWRIKVGVFILCTFVLCCLSLVRVSYAGVTVVQELNFGEFLVRGNNAQYDIVVNTDGSYTHDTDGYVEMSAPQEGIYEIDELPVNAVVADVTVVKKSFLLAQSRAFDILDFQTSYAPTTTASGVLTVSVGATVRSSGDGRQYPDATYNGVLEMQIDF